ncbi:MAG TPA: sugar ABC transporter substrate-binding protein [Solirubrobacterales bacterium]|jgi:D-xylose transport system substrate-binding protein|nr:sugar ABC transporter substrate-binding protein [Solirubrobacterales bacterium]
MSNPALLRRLAVIGCALLAVGLLVAGCGGSSGGGGTKIALLLPENETPRYESNDKPDFEKSVEEQCEDCEVLYSNAGGDASKQQSQAEAALTQGAEVLVVDPMDSKSAAAIAEQAKAQNVPVVSYDRLIENGEVDAYVSFDNEKVGELQAETLAKKLKEDGSASGPIIMINGDPADPNAALFKKGAHKGFEAAGVDVAKEYDTPGWSAENAQREAQQAITALGKDGFAGVYAANDDTGGGAIAALKGAGINPEEKPVTGQDATVAGLQRILAGQQYLTIYKEIPPQAKIAAELAIALAEGEEAPKDLITEEINNGKTDVPSAILEPVAVLKDNVKSTVVADGFVSASELCTGAYKSACQEAGISG